MSVAELIPKLGPYMRIEDVKSGVRFVVLDGEIYEPQTENIDAIRSIFKEAGYTPFFEPNKGSQTAPHRLKVGLFSLRKLRQRHWLNWLLLGITLITTTVGGALMALESIPEGFSFWRIIWMVLTNPLMLLKGLPYSLALILILGSHELGHYLTCRHYGVQATPPFFIPFLPLFGTMGAVIRMGLTPNRRTLIRIGAAGPIVGFMIAIPVTAVGIMLASVDVMQPGTLEFGEPLIFKFLVWLIKGPLEPGQEVVMNPLVTAGWLGFLVTSLNLLPLSQLDGGHIAYGLLGRKRIWLALATYGLMAAVVVGTYVRFRQLSVWLVWAAITLLIGFRHPPAEDEITPLKTSDILIAVAAFIILVLTVMPIPLQVIPPPSSS